MRLPPGRNPKSSDPPFHAAELGRVRAVHRGSLLGLQYQPPGITFPLDAKSANFDNIRDVQPPVFPPSWQVVPLNAGRFPSRGSPLGTPRASPSEATYEKSGTNSQWDGWEGAPSETRGWDSRWCTIYPADGRIHLPDGL